MAVWREVVMFCLDLKKKKESFSKHLSLPIERKSLMQDPFNNKAPLKTVIAPNE